MTVRDLLDQFDPDEDIELQINHEDYDGWDTVDVLWTYSPFLRYVLDKKITNLTAMGKDSFRFTLEE